MAPFDPLASLVALAFVALVAAAAIDDLRRLRIPNILPLALLALYPVHVLSAGQPVAWLPALGVAALTFALGLAAFAAGHVGGGDVKLLAAVALWAGPGLILPLLAVTALIGGALALVMVSPLRFAVALACERLNLPTLREVMLGRALPYGVAIAGGGALTVGTDLLAAL